MSKDDYHKSTEAGAKQGHSGQRDAQRVPIGQKLHFFGDAVIFYWVGPEIIWTCYALSSICA